MEHSPTPAILYAMNVKVFGVRCILFFFVCALFFNATPHNTFTEIGSYKNALDTTISISPNTVFAGQNTNIDTTVRGLHPKALAGNALAAFKGVQASGIAAIGQGITGGLMYAIGFIAFLLSFISTLALAFTAAILDSAVVLSTTGLSNIVTGSGRDAIDQTWRIFRDLANIGFVFVLLYVSITFILSADSSGTKKMLSNTIIAAFLVNFSFFFAALVVDVSNQMAIAVNDKVEELIGEDSISSFIAKKTEIQTTSQALGVTQNNVEPQDGADAGGGIKSLKEESQKWPTDPDAMIQWGTGMILTVILHLMLSIVFLIGAFMFISRTLTIILLLITSPIGFVGRVLPSTSKLGKDWWESLFGNAFALPVFLLFIYVAFKLIDGGILNVIPSTQTSANASYTQLVVPALIAPLLRYGIVIGFFIGALTAAKKMNSMGIAVVSKINGQITTALGGAAIGAAGYAGRNTVGRAARWASETDWLKNRAANSRVGQWGLQLAKYGSGATFDTRNSRTFKGVASATGIGEKEFGVAGGKGGYATQLKEQREARTGFAAEALGQIADGDPKSAAGKLRIALENEKEALDTLKSTGGTSAKDIDDQKEKVRKATLALATAKNARINAYGKRIDTKSGFWVGKKNRDAAKTIRKELAKASEDSKHDIVKALKAAKGDKKEEE